MERLSYGGLSARAFWNHKPLIGMVHLAPLPGSPGYDPDGLPLDAVLDLAAADARTLTENGVDAVLVENFFDVPFAKDTVPPHTIAAMTRAVQRVRETVGSRFPLGVNVLRNDARAAIAIAQACQAQFVRINVFVGAAVTDQGIIEGAARTAALYRRELGADVALFADIWVKHAAQLGNDSMTLEDAARDAALRGKADALIVSGAATGAPTDPETVRRVRAAVGNAPVLVGSGFDSATAPALLDAGASGAIVGSSLKRSGIVSEPVDAERVRALCAVRDASRDGATGQIKQ